MTIKPALSAEEWARVNNDRLDVRDWSWVGAPRGTPSISRDGMAAALLLGHFTWEDVDTLRERANPLRRNDELHSLADRIAALLPPREDI